MDIPSEMLSIIQKALSDYSDRTLVSASEFQDILLDLQQLVLSMKET